MIILEGTSMRVFLSFAPGDAGVSANLQRALRRQDIEAWSALDLRPDEDLSEAVDKASESADGYIFLLGLGASTNPHLLTEWRALLRNDSESKKALIPIINSQELLSVELPAFLRNRQRLLLTANYDAVVERVQYLLEHPNETRDRDLEEGKMDRAVRLEELKRFALALKGDAAGKAERL
jgi:hypothetical protein